MAALERRLATLERKQGVVTNIDTVIAIGDETGAKAKEKEEAIAAPPTLPPINLLDNFGNVEQGVQLDTPQNTHSSTTSTTKVKI